VIGCVRTLRLLARTRGDRLVGWQQAAAALLHALIAVAGAFPELARHVRLRPIRTEALMLILLTVLAHALVRRYMAGEGRADQEAPLTGRSAEEAGTRRSRRAPPVEWRTARRGVNGPCARSLRRSRRADRLR
jgi:hypothetical protein